MDIASIISKLGLPVALTQDISLLLIVILASVFFGMFIGRFRLITVLINIYVTLALLAAVPKTYISGYANELIFFFVCILIFTLFGRSLFEIPISGASKGFFWRVLVLSFLEIILLLSIILSIFPKTKALGYVSPSTYDYLVSPDFHFIWLILPLVFIFIIHKKLNR
jgi:hypothetical protein